MFILRCHSGSCDPLQLPQQLLQDDDGEHLDTQSRNAVIYVLVSYFSKGNVLKNASGKLPVSLLNP